MFRPQRPNRYPLLLPLRVWIRGLPKSNLTVSPTAEEETTTTNISIDGCYFHLSKAPPVGSPVQMEIDMATASGKKPRSKVVAFGTVVRVEKETATGKTGVACEFGRTDLVPTPDKH